MPLIQHSEPLGNLIFQNEQEQEMYSTSLAVDVDNSEVLANVPLSK